MRISDWSSDVCSSDLPIVIQAIASGKQRAMGFMPNDIMREIGLGADIRWIDENKIEALMDSHAPVTLAKLRTATHAQPLCISPRNGKRLLRSVNAHAACTPPFVQCCTQLRAIERASCRTRRW